MKLFNLDLHISVIADIKDILSRLYGDRVTVVDWLLSGHSHLMGRKRTPVEIVTPSSWIGINPVMISAFQEKYDDFLQSFDGFIVAHPNVFVLLFEKYNKPIIVVNTCRYDMPSCMNRGNTHIIPRLNECFRSLQDKGLLYFVSNNSADNKYFLAANPTIHTQIIPSLCLYTGMTWSPHATNGKFLLYSGTAPSNPRIVHRNTLGTFRWGDLMAYEGIIHIPYDASTMSQFEQISSGIPLFFPTKRFLTYLWTTRATGWHSDYWTQIGKMTPPSYLSHTTDPSFWAENADAYTLKGVYYFDSFEELFRLLDSFLDTQYAERQAFVSSRKESTLAAWKTLLDKAYGF